MQPALRIQKSNQQRETQPEGAMFHPKSQHPDGRSPPPPSSFTAHGRVCVEQVFAAVISRNIRHRCVSCAYAALIEITGQMLDVPPVAFNENVDRFMRVSLDLFPPDRFMIDYWNQNYHWLAWEVESNR